jgi:hypothetical protein
MITQQPNRAFLPRPMNRRWKQLRAEAQQALAARPLPDEAKPVTATAAARENADAFAANDAPIKKLKGTSNGKE